MEITVSEIIRKYLDENGFDGLCGDGCGCGAETDDLFPCCDFCNRDCVPAYKWENCNGCKEKNSEDGCEFASDNKGCYKTTKQDDSSFDKLGR